MIELHPEILRVDGKAEFAVLPWEEFLRVRELLEDAQDVLDLRASKADDDPKIPGVSLDEMLARTAARE